MAIGDLTLTGTPTLVDPAPQWTGVSGAHALDFATTKYGSHAYDAAMQITNNWTIALRTKYVSGSKYFLGKANGASADNDYAVVIGYKGAGLVTIYARSTGGTFYNTSYSLTLPNDANWHSVIFTYDGTNFRGFLNGTKIFDASISAAFATSTGGLWVGANYLGAGPAGMPIDDLRIYTDAASESEAVEIYNGTYPAGVTPLTMAWPMNDTTGSLLTSFGNEPAPAVGTGGALVRRGQYVPYMKQNQPQRFARL